MVTYIHAMVITIQDHLGVVSVNTQFILKGKREEVVRNRAGLFSCGFGLLCTKWFK